MAYEAWLPIGYALPDGTLTSRVLHEGREWQIVATQNGRALIVADQLMRHWQAVALVESGDKFDFAERTYWAITSKSSQTLAPIADCRSPSSKGEAMAFAVSLKSTRAIDAVTPLNDAIYVERLSKLLPTYTITAPTSDQMVLGYWLTGGAQVPVDQFRRLRQMLSWLSPSDLMGVVEAGGLAVDHVTRSGGDSKHLTYSSAIAKGKAPDTFSLPGRPFLENFFNEHIVDIVQNRDRYQALGIDFPGAVVLQGPPGCGKTFAVDALVSFLGWPCFQIDASSVASPYIHETSKKIANVFEKAIENAPAVLIIDEMDAFLADREMGADQHRVEEIAEFLRRIPSASKNEVLVIAMTNRIDMIDPAIMRRGRFDHVVNVDFASENEVAALLEKLLEHLPTEADIDIAPLAKRLAKRPLSDVAFVVREGARLAARSGRDKVSQESLLISLDAARAREHEEKSNRIGFV